MERRDFIKNTCKACLGLAASTAIISLLEGCATMPVYKTKTVNGLMTVPVEQFAATNMVIARNPQLDYDILVVKKDDGTYKALYMRCSHQDQPLSATNTGLYCTAHGSSFDLEGNVTKEPASTPLTSFKTEVENQSINIYIKK
jgi:nitrite reductase/ring-hydroxylating ferredoxin subunit